MDQTVERVHFVWPEDRDGEMATAVNHGQPVTADASAPLLRRKDHLTLYQGGRFD